MMRLSLSMLLIVAVVVQGCASFSPVARNRHADELARQAEWTKSILNTYYFSHLVYLSGLEDMSRLTIYVEGDGLAWINRNTPSSDPTPLNPQALMLALADHRGNVAYLGRPCQYVRSVACQRTYWTSGRFSPEVIASTNEAITLLKERTQAQKIELIGFSGGGAVAALVAARRNDVTRLITVAGNLDHKAWSRLHGISELTGSLNPADYWRQLLDIPQVHYVGGKDRNVPLAVAESYWNRFPMGYRPEIEVIASTDHHCCWVDQWPELLSELN